MTEQQIQRAVADDMAFRDFLLAELRCASLRSRLMTAELDSIGVALRGDFITTDDALAWLDDCGGLQLIAAPRESAGAKESLK